MILGLRSVVCPTPDLKASKEFFVGLLGESPSFDEPYYVGFSIGGYELGLDPDAPIADGAIGYWAVADIEVSLQRLVAAGATLRSGVQDVGEGVRVATVVVPGGSIVGIIEDSHRGV